MISKKSSTKTSSSTKARSAARPYSKQKKRTDIASPAHTQAEKQAWRATLQANEQVKELARRQARDTATLTSRAAVIRLVKISSSRKRRPLWSPSTSRRGPQTSRRPIRKSRTSILRFRVPKAPSMRLINSRIKHLSSTRPTNTRKPSALQAEQARGLAIQRINRLPMLEAWTAPESRRLVP